MTKRVLIADDEPNIVAALEYLLQKRGYDVRTVHQGAEALKQIEQFGPDLVLLDVMMPAVNGYEVCQHIKSASSLHHIKVILLSAKGRDVEVAKGIEMGADAYVTKPFSTRDLAAKVRDMLGE